MTFMNQNGSESPGLKHPKTLPAFNARGLRMRMHLQGEIPVWEFYWKPGAQRLGTGTAEDETH